MLFLLPDVRDYEFFLTSLKFNFLDVRRSTNEKES